jgi:tRNA dimethylallyltransferase
MIERGWVDEVQTLLNRGYAPGLKSMRSLGYKNIVSYLSGGLTLEQAIILTKRDTRRYAKRQITWFKADPEIIWLPVNQKNLVSIQRAIEDFHKPDLLG